MQMIDKTKLSMWLFLLSEIAFFGVLILAYIYYYRAYADGPNPTTILDPLLTGLFTICLLASSFTLWRAQKSIDRGNQGGLRAWLFATVALGTIFLAGQVWEYLALFRENIVISRSLFTTTFFTLTGVHGLHVFSGLIALTVLLGLALSGHLTQRRAIAVSTVELYWHFVDVVWIVIFTLIYVVPFL
jgi:heme/copper-type cytochrome/quinol oxidase subunit 3